MAKEMVCSLPSSPVTKDRRAPLLYIVPAPGDKIWLNDVLPFLNMDCLEKTTEILNFCLIEYLKLREKLVQRIGFS